MDVIYLSHVDLKLLADHLTRAGEPVYRASQVWEWAARGADGYDAMTNLPKSLRVGLALEVPFSTLEVEAEQHALDGTVKTLFRTADGHPV